MKARIWNFWGHRRRIKDAVRETEERTQSILNNVIDGIITIDEAGIIETANHAVERIFGYNAGELIGQSVSVLTPEPDRSAHRDDIARYLRTGETRIIGIRREVDLQRRDGSLVPLDLSVGAYRVAGRWHFTGVVRDTSERGHAEEANARLAAIVESSDDAIVGKDMAGVITSWSAGAKRIFGYEADEMIGRPIRVLIPPERPREEEAILNRICRGEKVEHYESVRITKDGRRIDVSLTISPIRDAKDRIVGASKIARDITEHKRDLEQLRERERMLHEAQRLAQVGSWELDLDDPSDLRRGALRCSDECFRIFGYEPGQVAVNYDLFLQAVHPDDRDLVAAALARAVRGNAPYSIEHRIVRPDGTERVLSAWDKVITDSTGRPIRMVVTIQDITERKRALVALQQYADRLEHLRKIDRAILASRSPPEIAEAALEHLARLVPCWSGSVDVYHRDRQESEVIASDGILREWYPPGSRFPTNLKERPELDALRKGQASTAEDVQETELMNPLMQALKGAGMRSYVLLPMLVECRLVGSLLLVSDRPAAFSAYQLEAAREVADHLAIAIRDSLLLDELRLANERLETLSRQLIRAQEDEQRRIARELHDGVGQSLTAVKIALDRLVSDPSGPDVGARLSEAAAMTGEALEQVRDLSRLLHPSLLDDLGLPEALRALVEGLSARAGLGADVEVEEAGPIDPDIQRACYRIAQEALTNAVKYAGAKRLRVVLHRAGDELELTIEDDGTGFDITAARARAVRGASLGVLSMPERAMLAGGRTEIVARPGGGTRVRIALPASGRPAVLNAGEERA